MVSRDVLAGFVMSLRKSYTVRGEGAWMHPRGRTEHGCEYDRPRPLPIKPGHFLSDTEACKLRAENHAMSPDLQHSKHTANVINHIL